MSFRVVPAGGEIVILASSNAAFLPTEVLRLLVSMATTSSKLKHFIVLMESVSTVAKGALEGAIMQLTSPQKYQALAFDGLPSPIMEKQKTCPKTTASFFVKLFKSKALFGLDISFQVPRFRKK